MGRNDNTHRNRNRNWGRNRTNNEKNTENRAAAASESRDRSDRSSRAARDAARDIHTRRAVQPVQQRQFANTITKKDIAEAEYAIKAYKADAKTCEICGKPIDDIDTALANRGSGNPVHFDCVHAKLAESELIGQNDKLTYIGQGKFAILHFENIHDMRHFTIKKEIEWESRESERSFWRNDMAGLYSQVK